MQHVEINEFLLISEGLLTHSLPVYLCINVYEYKCLYHWLLINDWNSSTYLKIYISQLSIFLYILNILIHCIFL